MRPQKAAILFVAASSALLLASLMACGGGDDEFQPGQITDPRSVPTTSPWGEPPEIVILDPNALPAGATPTPEASPAAGGEPGQCGPRYTIAAEDTFSSIAEKCGTTTQAIRDANPGVDPTLLHPGDVINLPEQ